MSLNTSYANKFVYVLKIYTAQYWLLANTAEFLEIG